MMALQSTSLNQNWLMLLEGEAHVFKLSLANVSEIEVNNIEFKFSDSTTEPLQAALQSKELPLNEIFECEHFLYQRKSLWLKKIKGVKDVVRPHESGDFEIQVVGKRGMTSAVIYIDYSNYVNEIDPGWSRRLNVPINVTVNPSIDLSLTDIILTKSTNEIDSKTGNLTSYLLVVDLRNSWSHTMEVTMHSKGCASATKYIYANRTQRFLVPIEWDPPSLAEIEKPIPLVSRKQYVVDSSMTLEQTKLMRETFWYREHLLSQLSGQWRIGDSDRFGEVEFRALRLSPRMVNVLRKEQFVISMSMIAKDDDNQGHICKQIGDNTWSVHTDSSSIAVRSRLANKTDQPVRGILRIMPSLRYQQEHDFDDVNRKLLFNGVLQRPVKEIPPGGSIEIDLGVMFISRGEYEWSSVFEIVAPSRLRLQQHAQHHAMYVEAL
jgi:hypothetical protein